MKLRSILLSVVLLISAAPCQTGDPPVPEWIWGSEQPAAGEQVWFHRAFELDQAVTEARLAATCDNEFALWLNGNATARGKNWSQLVFRKLDRGLEPGWNVLAVAGTNTGGPAGLALRLELELASGEVRTLVSDGSWRVTDIEPQEGWRQQRDPAGEWRTPVSFGSVKATRGPWPDPFTPRVATPAADIQMAPGFSVALLRSAQPGEGSWVSMTFDPRGRVILSPQGGQVVRSERPLYGAGAFASGEKITFTPLGVPIKAAHGMLYAHGSLYVNVVAKEDDGGGLHRLTDTDGDDVYDEDEVLRAHGHPGEHGTHGLALGPDGLLYVIVGNHVPPPAELAATSPHRDWAEDLLLPRLWDPRGHAVGVMAPGGHVLRTDPAGSRWEMVAAGMRNAYDLAFDAEGEMFTYDSDMEWDVGTPWYRAPRVLHITSGADFGWRSGTGKWPTSYPDTLPAVVDSSLSSPTGACFATGSDFPRHWRDALLICDWAYGRILAVHRQPDGASYHGTLETFARGKPLNVTDIEIGGDGACYFITGGRGTQSGLYRVRYTGGNLLDLRPVSELVVGTSPAAASPTRLRALRRQLEGLHGHTDVAALELAWPHLDHEDRWIRHAARVAVEHRPLAAWQERALAEERPRARLEVRLALARVATDDVRRQVLAELPARPWAQVPAAERIATLRLAALCYARGVTGADELVAPLRDWLVSAYPSGGLALDRELLPLLVHLQAGAALVPALDQLEAATTQEHALATALPLRLLEDGWDDDLRQRYLTWLRAARELPGGLSLKGFVVAIEKAWLEGMDEQTRIALIGPPSPPPGSEAAPRPADGADAAAPPPRPFVQAWTLADLEPHLEAVASDRDFERGRAAFTAALCNQCHRMAGQGGDAAPDLTGAGNRFSHRDLLVAILDPSQAISDQYEQVVVTRTDGTLTSGRRIAETETILTLDTNPFGGSPVEIAKAEVTSIEPSPVSLMPPGLLYTLTRDEVLDLLAYLQSGADPEASCFQK